MDQRTGQPPDQTTPPPQICGHWIGAEQRHCRSAEDVRHYLPGHRCPEHTPRALQGLPEIPPGPGWPAAAWKTLSPLSASSLFDERAVASGRRQSSAHVYQAARAAEERRKAGDR